jgi:hypothetical protein
VNERKPPPAALSGYLFASAVMLLVAPLSLLAWTAGIIVLRYGARRWVLAAAGVVPGVAAAGMLGTGIARHGATALLGSIGAAGPLRPSTALLGAVAGGFWRWAVVTAPLGIPAGLVAAAIPPRGPELPGPEWTAAARRRQARTDRTDRRRADRIASQPQRAPDDALGGWIAGDLQQWRRGRYVILPPDVAGLPRLVFGASGSGKTVLLVRETFLAGAARRRAILIDCKGDASFREQAICAYLRARPDARVLCWPGTPLDGWRGDPSAQLGRLLQVWTFPGASKWYGEVAQTCLRLALQAPGMPPVRSSGELMARLAGGHLQRLWDHDPDIAALLRGVADDIPGVQLRALNLLASLQGSLDGQRTWEDFDLVVCSIPVMANPADSHAAVRVLLADLAHHIAQRKPPGEPETIIVDEYGAVPGGSEASLHVAERGRSAGSASILAVQSMAGLGEVGEQQRLRGTAAAFMLLQSPDAEEVAKLAGTLLEPEMAWEVRDGEVTGRGTAAMRHHHRLDLNAIRGLRPGEAAVIRGSRAALMKVIREQPGPDALAGARRLALPSSGPPLVIAPEPEPERPALPEREP